MRNKLKHYFKILKNSRIKLGRLMAAHGASEYTILIVIAVLLGILAGLAAVGFHSVIHLLLRFFSAENLPGLQNISYILIGVPALGMFLQWFMTRRAPQEAGRRGVLEVVKAVSLRNGYISIKTTIFHFLAPVLCIGTGGTVGPEAPAAQTGAGVVSAFGKLLGLSKTRLRTVTAAGAGAAIAGVFNTPLAGVFFAIEVILLNDFRASALSVILLSSVSASAVSRIFLGNDPKFFFGSLDLGPYPQFIFFLILGIGAGLLSILFIKSNEYGQSRFDRLYKRIPKLPIMLLVGLIMGTAGFFRPEIIGIGYESINNILSHSYPANIVALLFILKFGLVILILRSGGFGGLFAPSLFLGACYGFLFAHVLSNLFNIPLDLTTYTLVGMGAMLAGVNSVPITAIMILFEMTNDYHFILPLMLGVVGSHTIANLVLNGSIYQRELSREGYRYVSGRETRILQSILVRDVAKPDILALPESLPIAEVVRRFLDEPQNTIYTLDEKNSITGVITSPILHHLITSYESLQGVLIAKDIAETDVVRIDEDNNLDQAMQVFSKCRMEEIPVVSRFKPGKILGALHYQDVLNAYNQNVGKHSLKDGLASDFKLIESEDIREVIPGFSLAELDLPEKFINKTLAKLDLRNRYKIDVMMVERTSPVDDEDSAPEKLMPDKNLVLNRGDRLIVYGRTLDVINFRSYFV